jgi:hypothetical protein
VALNGGFESHRRLAPLFSVRLCSLCVCSVETKGGEGLTEAQKQAFKDKVKDEE